jgi:hypothetical protein
MSGTLEAEARKFIDCKFPAFMSRSGALPELVAQSMAAFARLVVVEELRRMATKVSDDPDAQERLLDRASQIELEPK